MKLDYKYLIWIFAIVGIPLLGVYFNFFDVKQAIIVAFSAIIGAVLAKMLTYYFMKYFKKNHE